MELARARSPAVRTLSAISGMSLGYWVGMRGGEKSIGHSGGNPLLLAPSSSRPKSSNSSSTPASRANGRHEAGEALALKQLAAALELEVSPSCQMSFAATVANSPVETLAPRFASRRESAPY